MGRATLRAPRGEMQGGAPSRAAHGLDDSANPSARPPGAAQANPPVRGRTPFDLRALGRLAALGSRIGSEVSDCVGSTFHYLPRLTELFKCRGRRSPASAKV